MFYTFFVEVPRNPYENVNTFYIFRQQYRRKMYKMQFIYISLYHTIFIILVHSELICNPTENFIS